MALNAKTGNVVMALNAETKKWWWLWTPKPKMRWWWLWMPRLKMLMALNAKTENANGSERRDWDYDSGRRTETTALNAKRKMNSGSEHQMENEQRMSKWKRGSERQMEKVALNAKLEKWLWTPNRKMSNGCRNENAALNAKTESTALNAKRKTSNGSERPKRNNGSERQTKLNNHERQAENDDSERRNKEDTEALNTELKREWWGEIAPVWASNVWQVRNWATWNHLSSIMQHKWRSIDLIWNGKYAPVWHLMHDRSEEQMSWNHLSSHM